MTLALRWHMPMLGTTSLMNFVNCCEHKSSFHHKISHFSSFLNKHLSFSVSRTLRIADGPDEVHLDAIAKSEYEKQKQKYLFSARL
jgi:hypothetical protein